MGFWNSFLGFLKGGSPRSAGRSRKALINLEQYWQGRDKTYADEFTSEIQNNAQDLLNRVNALLNELGVDSVKVTSGWRPAGINKAIGGSSRSYHLVGKAVDLRDNARQEFATLLIKNNSLLHKYGLWLESPDATRGNTNWVHLDTGIRDGRELRVFNP
jgi:hypothetical protein